MVAAGTEAGEKEEGQSSSSAEAEAGDHRLAEELEPRGVSIREVAGHGSGWRLEGEAGLGVGRGRRSASGFIHGFYPSRACVYVAVNASVPGQNQVHVGMKQPQPCLGAKSERFSNLRFLDQTVFWLWVKIRQSQELRGPKTLNPKEIGL